MNNLKDVERQVKALMTYHGVGSVPFRFSKAYRSLAHVKYKRVPSATGPVIVVDHLALSRRWAMVLPDNDLWEIIIHEIAHIKTPYEAKSHGREFQANVRAMGATTTRRCYLPSVNIDGSPRS